MAEKWLRISSLNKSEAKAKDKVKQLEDTLTTKNEENKTLAKRLEKLQWEVAMVRQANDSLERAMNHNVKAMKSLQAESKENGEQWQMAD